MPAVKIALLALGTVAALALSAYTYLVREPKGRGRAALVALRTAALTLLVLLLIDPHFNAAATRRARSGPRVILDASLSMLLGPRDSSAWREGVREATRASRDGAVLLAGNGVTPTRIDSLSHIQPFAGESRVLPALQSAAEAGAERVVLITDGAIEDAAEVANWLPMLGISVDVRRVGRGAVANRAVSEVEAPDWAEAGKPLSMRIHIASSVGGRSGVVVRQNGNQIARTEVALIPNGTAAAVVSFDASGPPQGGMVRYDVALETADAIPDDDLRSVYVFVSEKPAGVAIVSFDPDWEPRFLHPVLEDALGLPVRTFLRVPAGIYFRAGNGLEAGARVDEPVVRRAVAEADLLVLHGLGPASPEWAQAAARTARRLIVFPGSTGIQSPIATSAAVEGDWYVSAELPASPISSLLAGIDVSALPPLTALEHVSADYAWAPLLGGRARSGGNSPLVIGDESDGRRWAVALGRGYWRWAFHGGAARDAYMRLWASLAGWIVQDQARVAGAAIRPAERAVPRGTPLRWVAPGLSADSLVLALRAASGATRRTVMIVEQGDTASSEAPAAGHYTYDITAYGGGKEIARARGPLTVETYSREFMRGATTLQELRGGASALSRPRRGAGRPLHTFAWVYALLAFALCAEWILRRRWGLR